MKKFFENKLEDMSEEIKSLKYILEDEGYLTDFTILQRGNGTYYNSIYVFVRFPKLISKEPLSSINPITEFVNLKGIINKKIEEFYKSEEFNEFFDRVDDICKQYGYKIRKSELKDVSIIDYNTRYHPILFCMELI